MRRRPVVLAALALFVASATGALEWPVEKRIVTGTFGEDRGDHFHLGLDIGGGEQVVRPVLAGELVFRYEENEDYTSMPRGVGSFAVIRHQDDVLSVYCHLRRETDRPARTSFTARDAVGVIGDTGYSTGKHLHFMVFDGQTGSFVNPLSLLPPVADREPPVVKRLVLRTGDRVVDLQPGITVPSGQAEVLVEAYDVREDVPFLWTLAPYVVRLALNGAEISRISFEALQVKEGRMILSGTALSAVDVYASERLLRLGTVELRGGESHLLVVVRDFAGNEVSREVFFTVRE
ncbi:MAG: peptidoglycan DD-metalloendopeptidase family protein [Spirochaetes bacterium]|nr:peptidoglycan DD-metalloendopeptidase family protein [Spirochaetota bacterium]